MNNALFLAILGATIAGAIFAVASNATAVARGNALLVGRTNAQAIPLGAVFGFMSLGVGMALNALANYVGFTIPMVCATGLGSLVFWAFITLTAPGTNAGFKWTMAGFAVVFGLACGLGGAALALFA
jgi:hypothetical protein